MHTHRFESECPGNDGRCPHGVMWGDRTDILGQTDMPCRLCRRDGAAKCQGH